MEYKEFLESMEMDIMKEHINKATQLTIDDLTSYGSIIENEGTYHNGLKQLLYYIMFYPVFDKTAVIDFATGCGKSTGMNNALAYMLNNKQLKQYSGTIILKLTQEDCNETMKAINDKTGKELAYAYHGQYDKENDRKRNSIEESELSEYPIVIMTHNGFLRLIETDKICNFYQWTDKKVNSKESKFNMYYRQRLIVDEQMNNVQFMLITMDSISCVENAIMNMGNEDLYNTFNVFIMKIKKEFLKPYDIKKNKAFFCEFENIEVPEGLDEVIYDCKDSRARESYLAIRTMLENGGYISFSDDVKYKSITTYKYINISNPFFSNIVLDATSSINYLYEIDKNFAVKNLPEIKSYKNMHLKIFNGVTGSSSSMKKALDDGLLESIIEDIKSKIVGDAKALIVTNSTERDELVKKSLEGYDKVNQIDVTHFGRTIGSNEWSKFDMIFVLGIQLLPNAIYPLMYFTSSTDEKDLNADKFNSLDTTLVPIRGVRKYKQEEFEKVKTSTIASLIVQTLNRIHCRAYVNGDCPETYAYFINRDKEVDNLIEKAMPEIQISYDWDLGYKSKKTGNQVDNKKDVVEILIEFFEKVRNNIKFLNILLEKEILTDKGLNKSKIKDLLNIKPDTFKKSMAKPLMLQYIKDNNIDLKSNNRYIKFN